MSGAARVGDKTVCPLFDGPKPHVGGTIKNGVQTVLIDGLAAANVGGTCECKSPAPNMIALGAMTVLIGNRPAARMGDPTAHGGQIVGGSSSVDIG